MKKLHLIMAFLGLVCFNSAIGQYSIPSILDMSNLEVGRAFTLSGSTPSAQKRIWGSVKWRPLDNNSTQINLHQTVVYNSRTLAESFSLNADLKARYFSFNLNAGMNSVSSSIDNSASLHLILQGESLYTPQYIDETDMSNMLPIFKNSINKCNNFKNDAGGEYYISGIRKGIRIFVDFQFSSSEISRDYSSYNYINANYSALTSAASLSVGAHQSLNELFKNSSISYQIYYQGLPAIKEVKDSYASLLSKSITTVDDYENLLKAVSDFIATSVKYMTYDNSGIIEYEYAPISNICNINGWTLPDWHTQILDKINEQYFLNISRINDLQSAFTSKYALFLPDAIRSNASKILNDLQSQNIQLSQKFDLCNRNIDCKTALITVDYAHLPEEDFFINLAQMKMKYEPFTTTRDIDRRWAVKHDLNLDNSNGWIVQINDTFAALRNKTIKINIKYNTKPPFYYAVEKISDSDAATQELVNNATSSNCDCQSGDCLSQFTYSYKVPDSGKIIFEFYIGYIYSGNAVTVDGMHLTNIRTIIDY